MLRLALPPDTPALLDIFLSARRTAMPWLPALHTDDETLWWLGKVVLPSSVVTVAVVDNTPAGFCARRGDMLDHLYVHPRAQAKGIGSALLTHAKAASPSGLRLHVFQQNLAARRFYQRHSFRVAELGDGGDNEEGLPDALYVWSP